MINITNKKDIIDQNKKFLSRNKLCIRKQILNVYWLPKLHKNPTKAWFILTGP